MSQGPFYEKGLYVCRVVQQGHGTSKNGNPMILLGIEPHYLVLHNPDGSEELELTTQRYERTVRLVVATDDQKDYALLKLRHAGFVGTSFSELNLIGADVRCQCDHQPGQGEHADRVYEQWDLQLPPRERQELEPLDKAAARKLDALFGRRLKAGGSQPAPRTAVNEPDCVHALDAVGDSVDAPDDAAVPF